MAAHIKTLKSRDGDQVIPRTTSSAVTMEDGTNLEYAINNVSSNSVKVPEEVAVIIGGVEGISLSEFLINYDNSTANTLAVAEVLE